MIAFSEVALPAEMAPGAWADCSDSPAILRLRLLEIKFAAAGPLSELRAKIRL